MQTFSNSVTGYLLLQKMSWQTTLYMTFGGYRVQICNKEKTVNTKWTGVMGSLDITWTEDAETVKICITETLHDI
jgi:hypothetical protein